jgi:hypothetical protein
MKLGFLRGGYRVARAAAGVGWFVRDLRAFKALDTDGKFPFGELYPCLDDREGESGAASGHYFHQDLLVARRIFESRPVRHIDVGSRIDGFVAHVACFREIEVFDIRPLRQQIPNVKFTQADLSALPSELHGVTDSLSCLHALEHFGLGRYGDPIDPVGHLKGLAALHALLEPGGMLYLSVPMGPQRIEFNAHRVFSAAYLLELVRDRFDIEAFSYVDDKGDLHEEVALADADIAANYGCNYGCAILELRRT